ncbi:response regulator transcription factor [Flammeovirgaceae bacterium SG7u.111]|nr:response regulator transcription factor [Flammeovirgaceae bacterium SG7u.132]WPO36644.1 response regulator transcription factor [Flammeovirgaceae bacterium SG7u.111]
MLIKTLIADDHQIIIDGIMSLLEHEEHVEIVGQAHDGEEVIEMCGTLSPDLIIMDINMPKVNGVEASRTIRAEYPTIKILILTMHNDANFIKTMAEIGTHGFILKNTGLGELLNAISLVMAGNTYYSQQVTETLVKNFEKKDELTEIKLTPREKEVLVQLYEGKNSIEIAEKLFISSHTVQSHRKNLLSKFGVNNTTTLLKEAVARGIITV